jgi:hypothetical protein
MKTWANDLKTGALHAVLFILGMRLFNIILFGDFDFPTGGFLVFWFLWCWAIGTYRVRRMRIQQEIADLMTALRIARS